MSVKKQEKETLPAECYIVNRGGTVDHKDVSALILQIGDICEKWWDNELISRVGIIIPKSVRVYGCGCFLVRPLEKYQNVRGKPLWLKGGAGYSLKEGDFVMVIPWQPHTGPNSSMYMRYVCCEILKELPEPVGSRAYKPFEVEFTEVDTYARLGD